MSYLEAEPKMRELGWIVSVNGENILFEKKNHGLEMKVMIGKDPQDLYFVSVAILREGNLVEERRCGTKFANSLYNNPIWMDRIFYGWVVPLMKKF